MVIQCQILNKILQTKDFSIVTENNLTEQEFFNYKEEFNYIKNHYEKYQTIPDKLTFINVFPNFDVTPVNEPDDYLVSQILEEAAGRQLAIRFNKIRDFIENGKVNEALEYFQQTADNVKPIGSFKCTDLMTDTSRYDRYIEKASNPNKYYISTGFPELDNLIGGIDVENEDMVIAARTGIGKSWLLIKLAVAASCQGKTVGIFSGEMTTDKVGYRVDTLLGHINNRDIMRGNLYSQNIYKEYIKTLGAGKYGPIKVVTPNDIAGEATVSALQAFVEKEHLDILFIDQYSLLEDSKHAKANFEQVANISKAIKKLQVSKRIPIISVSQMNRTKNEDGSQDTTQIGLSDRIGQDATVILMLDKKVDEEHSDSMHETHQFIINIVKARDGGDSRKLVYNVDFNTGNWTYIPEDISDLEAQAVADAYSTEGNNVF